MISTCWSLGNIAVLPPLSKSVGEPEKITKFIVSNYLQYWLSFILDDFENWTEDSRRWQIMTVAKAKFDFPPVDSVLEPLVGTLEQRPSKWDNDQFSSSFRCLFSNLIDKWLIFVAWWPPDDIPFLVALARRLALGLTGTPAFHCLQCFRSGYDSLV